MAKPTRGGRGRAAGGPGIAGAAAGVGGGAGAAANLFGGGLGLGANMVTGQRVQPQGPTDHDPNWAHMTVQENRQLQRRMGQTGNEAGLTGVRPSQKLYVGTSKSYNINKFLNTDMQDMKHPDSNWDDPNMVGSWNALTPGKVKQMIRDIDSGMKPIPVAVNATRVETSGMTLSTFGLDNYKISDIMKMDQGQLDQLFTGRIRYNKGYTSMAHNESGIKFAAKSDVCIEYTLKSGTKVIQTNNLAEHETILGRGYAQKATAARIGNAFGKKMLIINVTVIPQDQSGWYKV